MANLQAIDRSAVPAHLLLLSATPDERAQRLSDPAGLSTEFLECDVSESLTPPEVPLLVQP